MRQLLQIFLLGLVMASVVTAQLFGAQRGYLAVVNGVTFLTTADHHHCGPEKKAPVASTAFLDCGWLDFDSEDCDPTDLHQHDPFVENLQVQAASGVQIPVPLLAVMWALPAFSFAEEPGRTRAEIRRRNLPPMPLLIEAARVCRSVILLL